MDKVTPPPSGPCCPHAVSPKASVVSVLCRICYDSDKDEPLIAPCHCKGTVAFVHRSCLERWLAESNTTVCELCHVVFRTERSPKYSSKKSIWRWIKTQRAQGGVGRGVRSDIIACAVITPIAILITYICLFSSDYYNQKKFIMVPAARWTSISLLIMIGIMLLGYYLWVYSVIRLHSRMWYNWWQRECVVRYIPPSQAHICCHNPNNLGHPPNNTPISLDMHLEEVNNEINVNRVDVETNAHLEESISDFELESSSHSIHNDDIVINIEEIIDNVVKNEENSNKKNDDDNK